MVDVTDKKVFLCGPMTGLDAYNVAGFAWANKKLRDMGAEYVFDPAFEWYESVANGHEVSDHDECMTNTIRNLVSMDGRGQHYYDMVVTLDGWRDSAGARTEIQVALACGIPVYEFADVVGS